VQKLMKALKDQNPQQNIYFSTSFNRGQDVGGFLISSYKAAQLGKSYQYICKIHTKADDTKNLRLHGEAPFGTHLGWRNELLETLLGSEEQVKKIINIFKSYPSIGFVSNQRFYTDRFYPEANKEKYIFLAKQLNLDPENCWPRNPNFLAGTMFWITGDVWTFLAKKKMPINIFEEGAVPDGFFSHAMERLFVAIIRDLGYGEWMLPPLI